MKRTKISELQVYMKLYASSYLRMLWYFLKWPIFSLSSELRNLWQIAELLLVHVRSCAVFLWDSKPEVLHLGLNVLTLKCKMARKS